VDVETLYVTDIHSTTSKKHDAEIGPQVARISAGDLLSLAADRGYDGKSFCDELRDYGVRPLIKHRIYFSLDLTHNV
jgi:IS5 family transposase